MVEQEPGLDVYPVGLLHDLLFFARTLQRSPTRENLAFARRKLVRGFKTGWRRRSYWNGYLAEQSNGRARRAGHGWTQDRPPVICWTCGYHGRLRCIDGVIVVVHGRRGGRRVCAGGGP